MKAAPFVPDDPALPGLAALFADRSPPPAVLELASRAAGYPLRGEAAVLSYARYWPGRRAVAQWTFDDGQQPVIVSAELDHRDQAAAETPVSRVEVFPNDRVLTALATVTDPRWAAANVAPLLGVEPGAELRMRPLSYKSWRRCVIEYAFEQDGRPRRVYGKLFRDDRGAALYRRLRDAEAALAAAGSIWRLPRTLAYLPEVRMLLQEELPGAESLSELARRAPGDEATTAILLDAVRGAARALSELQSLPLPDPPLRTPAVVLESLQEDVDAMARVAPGAARSLQHVLHLLSAAADRLPPESLVTAHGAFRHSHIFRMEDGLGLLDLDNLGLAAASADAGYFLAYLRFAALNRPRLRATLDACGEAFLNELPAASRHTPRWRLFYLRAVLLKWALRSFFSLERDWREIVEAVVEVCNSEARTRPLPIDDPYLQRGASRSLLTGLAREKLGPRFWPQAERIDLQGAEIAFEPGRECVVDASLLITPQAGAPERERVVFTFADEAELTSSATRLAGLEAARWQLLTDERCLAEVFPTDYRLPALARALTPGYLAGLLQQAGLDVDPAGLRSEVMRYRPHERCVIGFRAVADGGPRYVVKIYDDRATAEEVWTTLRALRSQLVRPNLVVEPLAVDANACIVTMEFVQGVNLGHAMDATTDEAEMRALTAEAAATLAALHSLKLEHERIKTYASEAAKLRRHAQNIRRVAPNLADAVDGMLDRIDAQARLTREPRPSFVHGGFKPTQLLRRSDGVTVVDFDGSCLGDPAMDVGRFMAKLKADSLDPARAHLAELDQFFLQRYLAESSHDVRPRARTYQALALVRMATRRFQTSYVASLRRRRESVSDGLLRLAGQVLA